MLYKGRTIEVKEKGFQEALARLRYMHESGLNLVPVWEDIIDEHSRTIQAGFDARQSPDTPPDRWTKLSKKYSAWKFRHYGVRVANLVLNGRLRKAVRRGPGWFQKVVQTGAEWGIKGIDYAAVHEDGSVKKNIPQRNYFLKKDGTLPSRVVTYMVTAIEKHLTGEAA